MGLKFIENAGGTKMFYCASCNIYLADKASCISTSFSGTTGQAYLFKRAINVTPGPLVLRGMMTGDHYVRDISCQSCKEKIGWMYEQAPTKEESYKEGCYILERLHIVEVDSITTTSQLEGIRRRDSDVDTDMINRLHEEQHDRLQERMEADQLQNVNNVFRLNAAGEAPAVALFDEQEIAQTFGFDEIEMNRTRSTVRRLNAAIRSCARGSNTELWSLGFRADTARQFREMREIMEGQPYHPSRAADHNLVLLFERMERERERMQFHQAGNFDHLDFEDWVAQNEAFFREHAEANDDHHREPYQEDTSTSDEDEDEDEDEDTSLDSDSDRLIRGAPRRESPPVERDPQIEMMLRLEGLLVINEQLELDQLE